MLHFSSILSLNLSAISPMTSFKGSSLASAIAPMNPAAFHRGAQSEQDLPWASF